MPTDISKTAHSLPIRVYYEDTDAGGIVYYANYLKYFERARTEWLRALGVSQIELANTYQQLFVVKKTEVEYHRSAKHDDLLHIHSQLIHLGGASLVFAQQAVLSDEPLCHSQTVVLGVHKETMRPMWLHPIIRAILEKVHI